MTKHRIRYEYRWKIQIEGYKTTKRWGLSYIEAFKDMKTVLKGYGFDKLVSFKIGAGRHIIRLTKKHKFGTKVIVAYLIRLNIRRQHETIIN